MRPMGGIRSPDSSSAQQGQIFVQNCTQVEASTCLQLPRPDCEAEGRELHVTRKSRSQLARARWAS